MSAANGSLPERRVDPGAYLSALAADSQAMVDSAGPILDRPVPGCPDWDVAALVTHLGGVYSWTASVVEAGGSRPERRPDEQPARTDLIEWFAERRRTVLDVLGSRDPDDPAWAFTRAQGGDVAWWRRRQAMETAIHLYDLQAAGGNPGTIGPELAADGVEEFLAEFLPAFARRNPDVTLSGTLHLHATDTAGEWSVDLADPAGTFSREHSKGDAALRGPAAGLFLWVWNRATPEDAGVESFGDPAVLASWSKVRL